MEDLSALPGPITHRPVCQAFLLWKHWPTIRGAGFRTLTGIMSGANTPASFGANNQGFQAVHVSDSIINITGSTQSPLADSGFDRIQVSMLGSLILLPECLHSLAFPDMRRRGDLKAETENTCAWLLQHSQYKQWAQNGGVLLVEGRAGSGKSTLIQHALCEASSSSESEGYTVMSFFFHRQGAPLQHSLVGFLRSLLHQLLSRDHSCLTSFMRDTGFERRCRAEGEVGTGWTWSAMELRTQLVRQLRDFGRRQRIRLFVDAMDESDEGDRLDIVECMMELAESAQHGLSHISICVSSRPIPKLRLTGARTVSVEKENHDDIQQFVAHTLRKNSTVFVFTDGRLIRDQIVRRACGVFQWAALVLHRIITLLTDTDGEESTGHILREIDDLPIELADVYEVILGKLSKQNKALALRISRWLVFSETLSLAELRHAVAIDPDHEYTSVEDLKGTPHLCEREEQLVHRVKWLFGGVSRVVVVDNDMKYGPHVSHRLLSGTRYIEFDHESVYEYLRDRGIAFLEKELSIAVANGSTLGRSHNLLSRSCTRYIKLPEVAGFAQILATQAESQPRLAAVPDHLPFLKASIKFWMSHAVLAEHNGVPQETLLALTAWPANDFCTTWHVLRELMVGVPEHRTEWRRR